MVKLREVLNFLLQQNRHKGCGCPLDKISSLRNSEPRAWDVWHLSCLETHIGVFSCPKGQPAPMRPVDSALPSKPHVRTKLENQQV